MFITTTNRRFQVCEFKNECANIPGAYFDLCVYYIYKEREGVPLARDTARLSPPPSYTAKQLLVQCNLPIPERAGRASWSRNTPLLNNH